MTGNGIFHSTGQLMPGTTLNWILFILRISLGLKLAKEPTLISFAIISVIRMAILFITTDSRFIQLTTLNLVMPIQIGFGVQIQLLSIRTGHFMFRLMAVWGDWLKRPPKCICGALARTLNQLFLRDILMQRNPELRITWGVE